MLHHLLEERYPRELTLRDGNTVTIRPLGKDDKEALLAFVQEETLAGLLEGRHASDFERAVAFQPAAQPLG